MNKAIQSLEKQTKWSKWTSCKAKIIVCWRRRNLDLPSVKCEHPFPCLWCSPAWPRFAEGSPVVVEAAFAQWKRIDVLTQNYGNTHSQSFKWMAVSLTSMCVMIMVIDIERLDPHWFHPTTAITRLGKRDWMVGHRGQGRSVKNVREVLLGKPLF